MHLFADLFINLQQRRALVRLLELSHSENTDGKKFAAANFKHYIALFPDLEDDVINAIYDLCEDQASLVREMIIQFRPTSIVFYTG